MAIQWMRCKSCGFVMEEGKIGDVCPACGVKRIMFAPDTEKISEGRRRILNAHVHPIIVHFPQAFATTLFIMAVAAMFLRNRLGQQTADAMTILAYVQPFVVIGAFLTGLLDGRTRFRKLTTPMMRIKIVMGAALLMIAIAGFVVALRGICAGYSLYYVFMALSFCGMVCTALLGRVGADLSTARFPG